MTTSLPPSLRSTRLPWPTHSVSLRLPDPRHPHRLLISAPVNPARADSSRPVTPNLPAATTLPRPPRPQSPRLPWPTHTVPHRPASTTQPPSRLPVSTLRTNPRLVRLLSPSRHAAPRTDYPVQFFPVHPCTDCPSRATPRRNESDSSDRTDPGSDYSAQPAPDKPVQFSTVPTNRLMATPTVRIPSNQQPPRLSASPSPLHYPNSPNPISASPTTHPSPDLAIPTTLET